MKQSQTCGAHATKPRIGVGVKYLPTGQWDMEWLRKGCLEFCEVLNAFRNLDFETEFFITGAVQF